MLLKYYSNIQETRKIAYGLLGLIAIGYGLAFALRGFNVFYDERMDFIRGTRILEYGLEGFYDEEPKISPYPPLALILIALFRLLFPTLILFKLAFLLIHILDWFIFYIILERTNFEIAPFMMLGLLTFPFLRLGLITLHPTDYFFLLFLLLSIYLYPKDRLLSLILLGLSIATKWYTILAGFFLPYFYYTQQEKRFMFKSMLILWSSILMGLIIPIVIFPNYLNIYSFHARKSAEVIKWITYSYGFSIPVINLPKNIINVAGYVFIVIGFLVSLVIIGRGKSTYVRVLSLSLISFMLFSITKQPSLRFCVFPLITTSLEVKERKNLLTLFLSIPLFFFRRGFIQALLILLMLFYINFKLSSNFKRKVNL